MLPNEILKRLTRTDRAGHWIDPLTGEVYSLGDWEPTSAKTESPKKNAPVISAKTESPKKNAPVISAKTESPPTATENASSDPPKE